MGLIKKRILFYIGVYAVLVLVAVGGLLINIKTNDLNRQIIQLQADLDASQQANQRLYLEVLSATRLSEIDRIATNELNMRSPTKLYFISPDAP